MADDIRTLRDREFMSLSGRRSMLALSLATLALLGLPMRAQAQTERKTFSPRSSIRCWRRLRSTTMRCCPRS